jgi:hypothetical protein
LVPANQISRCASIVFGVRVIRSVRNARPMPAAASVVRRSAAAASSADPNFQAR